MVVLFDDREGALFFLRHKPQQAAVHVGDVQRFSSPTAFQVELGQFVIECVVKGARRLVLLQAHGVVGATSGPALETATMYR